MGKQKTWVAAFLLLILPLSLFAQAPMSEEAEDDPAQDFLLSICTTPTAQLIPAPAFCLAPFPSTPVPSEKFTFRSWSHDFLHDAGEIWSYPVHIRTRDILPIAGLAVLTGLLIGNDETIRRGFMDYRSSHAWVRAASPVITGMGTYGAWGTAAAFLCVGLIAKDDKAVETATLAASAMLQSGILVMVLKGLAGRQRPLFADGVDRWSGPIGFFKRFGSGQYGKYDSFPGGHSITAFTLATVLAMQYRESGWVPILAYTLATGVALSRVTEGRHWLSDCLVGGVLGHLIGRLVVLNHRRRHSAAVM
ncbi:MAG: phosphatase PAP2 family protein [Candidatus Aminicenantes bacterium]|nr:phosphatase PAP2 family protein [Candidatus Aminicenantes bacterium]